MYEVLTASSGAPPLAPPAPYSSPISASRASSCCARYTASSVAGLRWAPARYDSSVACAQGTWSGAVTVRKRERSVLGAQAGGAAAGGRSSLRHPRIMQPAHLAALLSHRHQPRLALCQRLERGQSVVNHTCREGEQHKCDRELRTRCTGREVVSRATARHPLPALQHPQPLPLPHPRRHWAPARGAAGGGQRPPPPLARAPRPAA